VESLVWLKGNSELSLWVNRVCGVGKDYIMFNVSDTRESVSSKTKITQIIASFSPFYSLLFFQCLLFQHFYGFLKTRVEITGELRSGADDPSEMVPETTSDSGFGSLALFTPQGGSEALLLCLRERKIVRVTWTNILSFHPSPLKTLFSTSSIVLL
jgi:hypothetical protein